MRVIPIHMEGDVYAGANLATLILDSVGKEGEQLQNNDVLVVAHKIVSKAEGRVIDLATVKPSKRTLGMAKRYKKDPRIVELILRESRKIIKMERGIIITETKNGLVCANSGVDVSNVDGDSAALLPVNPDRSAEIIRAVIKRYTDKDVAVMITDTFGRPFREGQVNVAIGLSGLQPIRDYRGSRDMFGKKLKVTQMAVADEVASAAELVMKKSNGVPVAIVRGLDYVSRGSARQLIRKRKNDLFR